MERCRCLPWLLFLAVSTVTAHAEQSSIAHPDPAAPPARIGSASCSEIAAKDPRLTPVSKLCEFAFNYRHLLPDFIVQQTTTSRTAHSTTVMTAQVTFRKGRDYYSQITLNGKPVSAHSSSPSPGDVVFTSSGEFGSLLVDLFSRTTGAEFKFRKTATLQGVKVNIYDFQVARKNNGFWTLRNNTGRAYKPELRGQLWLDQATGYPLREMLQPLNVPADFGVISAGTEIDYAMTAVGDAGTFLLPVKSGTSICLGTFSDWQRWSWCTTNVLVFHDYHKFGATTRILPADNQP
jgi:hypothetical protein